MDHHQTAAILHNIKKLQKVNSLNDEAQQHLKTLELEAEAQLPDDLYAQPQGKMYNDRWLDCEKSLVQKWISENPDTKCEGEEMEELMKATNKTVKQIQDMIRIEKKRNKERCIGKEEA